MFHVFKHLYDQLSSKLQMMLNYCYCPPPCKQIYVSFEILSHA